MALLWKSQIKHLPLAQIDDLVLTSVLVAWRHGERRASAAAPWRIGISALKFALPYMALVELDEVDGPRYQIFGPALRRLLGVDPQGKFLKEVYHPKILGELLETFSRVRSRAQPIYSVNEFRILWKDFGYRRLVLPLTMKDGTIGRMIVVLQPLNPFMKDASEWKRHLTYTEGDGQTSWDAQMQTAEQDENTPGTA